MIQSYHSQGLRGVVAEVPLLGGGAAGGGHRLRGVVLGLPAQQQHAARVGVPDGVPPPAGEEGVGGGPGARGEGEAAVLRVVPAAVHQPGLAVPVGALALGQAGKEAGGAVTQDDLGVSVAVMDTAPTRHNYSIWGIITSLIALSSDSMSHLQLGQ